jgi:soluble lytic murein transglycosylase-like protein
MMLVASTVSARNVAIHVFESAPSSGFQLIEPRRDAVGSTGELPPDLQIDTSLRSATARSPEPGIAIQRIPVPIPDWMRAGRTSPPTRQSDELAPMNTEDCRPVPYRPYVGLSPDSEARRQHYYWDMVLAACTAGVPVHLFDSLIVQESRYNPRALSPAGAIGIAQLMPGTARGLRVGNPWDVRENLRGGARYLRQQLDEFGHWHLALSAYNAGPGNVRRYGGIPPFQETKRYIRSILAATRLNLRAAQAVEVPGQRRVNHVFYR